VAKVASTLLTADMLIQILPLEVFDKFTRVQQVCSVVRHVSWTRQEMQGMSSRHPSHALSSSL
jgi:hypothetical protein